jgi:hypothetical protein
VWLLQQALAEFGDVHRLNQALRNKEANDVTSFFD